MNIFLTGATGFIGSFLAEALVKKGHKVKCLLRRTSKLTWIADLDIECIFGSMDDTEALNKGLDGADYVYHLAGVTKSLEKEAYFKGNMQGTQNLVDCMLKKKLDLKRFLFLSSQAAAGPSPTIEPITEESPLNPINLYGQSKLAAEEYVKKYFKKIPTTIIRPPAVFGPRDTDILEYFKTVRYGIIPRLEGKEKYLSLIYVKDLVKGIVMAAESEATLGKIYFLAMDKPIAWEDFARLILHSMGKKGLRLNVPIGLIKGAAFVTENIARFTGANPVLNKERLEQMKPDFWICSPKKARNDFNFRAETTLEVAIKETYDWYKEHKWL